MILFSASAFLLGAFAACQPIGMLPPAPITPVTLTPTDAPTATEHPQHIPSPTLTPTNTPTATETTSPTATSTSTATSTPATSPTTSETPTASFTVSPGVTPINTIVPGRPTTLPLPETGAPEILLYPFGLLFAAGISLLVGGLLAVKRSEKTK